MEINQIYREDLDCPRCQQPHEDVDEWALRPHKTHLCLNCSQLFEGTLKGVSRPKFIKLENANNVSYIESIKGE